MQESGRGEAIRLAARDFQRAIKEVLPTYTHTEVGKLNVNEICYFILFCPMCLCSLKYWLTMSPKDFYHVGQHMGVWLMMVWT